MLFRKLLRDLVQNRTQFISIFLMSFLGMWIFVGINAESTGGSKSADTYYTRCNLADFWIAGEGFSNEEERKIEELNGVNGAERRLMLEGDIELEDDKYSMLTMFLTTNEISRLEVLEGSEYEEGKEGFWLEEIFAKAHKLKIGDTITIDLGTEKTTGIVQGYVRNPEYAYYLSAEETMMPNYANYGYAFASEEQYPAEETMIYNQMIVDAEGSAVQLDILKEKLKNTIDRSSVVVTNRDQNASYAMFKSEMDQHKAMGLMFSAVFLLIAVLGIVTTMTRITANQRTQIGTLKALGFSKRVITGHYVSYGFWISLSGSILGAVVGYFMIPPLIFGAFTGSYIIPDLQPGLSPESVVAVVLSISVSTAVSFLACRKELVSPPAVTLKPEAPKKTKHSALEKSKLWLRLSFSTQWNLRDVLRNKVRSLMGIIGVCGCTMLMLGAFGCQDSIYGMMDWQYDELMTGKGKILLSEEADYYTAMDYKNQYKGQLVEERSVEFQSENAKKTGSLTVLDNGNFMHYQGEKLEKIQLNKKGIAMSSKLAKSLGVRTGDYMRWHIVGEEEWEKTRITQIYRDPSVQGITMYREVYEQLEHTFTPTTIITNKTIPTNLVDREEIQSVMNIADMEAAFMKSVEVMSLMIVMMVTGAVILGVVVLYNLGVLSFVEKTREIATLKVLGFKSRKIRGILLKQNVWITTVGVLVGVPIGYYLLILICQTLPDTMDMAPLIYLPSYLYSILGTYAVSIGVNVILSGKVNTINMVDALKGVE